MLHVIGMILKIIGILLLVILGLLLLIILTILLVPIRYRVNVEHGEELLEIEGGVSWLLHLISARFTYIKGVFHIKLRVLWFTLFDNLQPKKPKEQKKPKKQKRPKEQKKLKKQKKSKILNEQVTQNNAKSITQKTSGKDDVHRDSKESTRNVNQQPKNENTLTQRNVQKEESLSFIEEKKETEEAKEKSIFHKILDRIKGIIEKIKNAREKIKEFFIGLKNKIQNLFTKATGIKNKISLISDFINDKINKEGFQITYNSLKRLLKHILPTKFKSRIVFGTGDPCSTGQAIGVMSILYSYYGDKIQIIPDFENKTLEGKHYARGKIRLITILYIVIKLILDKRFKKLRKNLQILKEAL